MKAYKLKFLSSFHIDAGNSVDGPSDSIIRSDTLFSAICTAVKTLYGDSEVIRFLEPGAMVLSSAFPWLKDELFLPKPLSYFPDIQDYESIKDFKKVKWIAKEHLENLITGKGISKDYLNKAYILNGCLLTGLVDKNDVLFKTQENPHIVVDRVSNRTQIFYKTEVFYSSDAGLFFIADIRPDLEIKFEAALRFLGDEGIGSDRTSGKGVFEITKTINLSFPSATETDYYCILSLYSPDETEFHSIIPNESFYDFEIRKGWVFQNTYRRKSLRVFTEGSVLKFINKQKPKGMIHNVLEKEHYEGVLRNDIFRSGQVLAIPIAGVKP